MSDKGDDPVLEVLEALQGFVNHFHKNKRHQPMKRFDGPLPRCRVETFNKIADRVAYEQSLDIDTRDDQAWFDSHSPARHVFRRVTELEQAAFGLDRSELVNVELKRNGSHLRLFMSGAGIDLSNIAFFGRLGNPFPKSATRDCPQLHCTDGGFLISTSSRGPNQPRHYAQGAQNRP